MPRRAELALAGLGLVTLTACDPTAHAFTGDRSLVVEAPAAAQKVGLPVEVRWRVSGFTATGLDGRSEPRAGTFAVFVDRAPMPPGKDLSWFGRDDPSCRAPGSCLDEGYLAAKQVYVRTATELALTTLPAPVNTVGDEQHAVTVVLLDGTGRRTTEASWYRSFTIARRGR